MDDRRHQAVVGRGLLLGDETAQEPAAIAAGIDRERLAALPDWRSSPLFDAEQRLVIEYSEAVAGGRVDDTLFARMIACFGERGTIEATAVAAFWAFWGLFLTATGAGEDEAAGRA